MFLPLPARIALAALSVAFVALSVPGGPAPWLALICIVPLGLACQGLAPRHAFSLSLFTCWLFWLYAVYWLAPALVNFSGTGSVLAFALLVLVCLLCALPMALAFLLLTLDNSLCKHWGAVRAALLYTLVLSWFPSLVPGNPVHFLFRYPVLLQLADTGGLPLLYFVHGLFQFLIVRGLMQGFAISVTRQVTGATALVLAVVGYGEWRIHSTNNSNGTLLTVASLQPNLHREDQAEVMVTLSRAWLAESQSKPDLLAWPEVPPALSLVDNAEQQKTLLDFSEASELPLLLTSGYVYSRDNLGNRNGGYYNASHLLDTSGRQDYYKRRLVPFFEFLPLADAIPWLRQRFPNTLNYKPGQRAEVFPLGDHARLIPLICYEGIFTNQVRDFVEAGGNIIINPVSDTWFGDSRGSALHLALGLIRSIEYRVPFVRVANSGISVAINPSGEIVPDSETQLNTRDFRLNTVLIPEKRSHYSRFGDWFLYLATACAGLMLMIDRFRHRSTI